VKQKNKELDKVQKEEERKNNMFSQVRAMLSNDKLPDRLRLDGWTCQDSR
jgi:hypothetical protein